jgi:Transposase IS4
MGVHKEPATEDYWNSSLQNGPIHGIGNFISCSRWHQIDRYFYCTKPKEEDDEPFQNTFQRIEDLSEHLRLCCRRFYKPGIHLAVDESIKRFTGRASKIVNIPSKPTPKGFKIWILANQGYVLNWLFHSKGEGKGPYDLDKSFVKDGFTKTEAVVLNLMLQEDAETKQRLYQPHQHVVWLSNLFTSIKLLKRLRAEGLGSAGTVRTTQTARKRKDKNSTKNRQEQMSSTLINLKLLHEGQIPWGTLYAEVTNNGQVLQLAWKDARMVLFMTTIGNRKLELDDLNTKA